jgi:SMP-30/Gluconolactonase/LRE-like region
LLRAPEGAADGGDHQHLTANQVVRLPSRSYRPATGCRFNEGAVYFGDARCLLWSDIPNNRIMRWEEETGRISIFRQPSNHANGNTRDRQGRLITCEHSGRRITRTEYDGTIAVLIDRFDGKRLNGTNDVVVKSDDTIWFTDPPSGISGNYLGVEAKPELPFDVYRLDPKSGLATVVTTGLVKRPTDSPSRPTNRSSMSSRARPRDAQSTSLTWSTAERSSPTAAYSSTAKKKKRPTAFGSTSTVICGAAGA